MTGQLPSAEVAAAPRERTVRGVSGSVLGVYMLMNVIVRGGLAMLSLYAVSDLRMSGGTAALLLAFATAALRFGRSLTAPAAARIGVRWTTITSFTMVAGGYLLLAERTQWSAWAGMALVGLGFGTCLLMLKVHYTSGAASGARARRLSYLALMVNIGAAIGPLTASEIAAASSRATAYLVLAAVAAVTAVAVGWLPYQEPGRPPAGPAAAGRESGPPAERTLALLRRPVILGLLGLVVANMVIYAQLNASIPLLLLQISGSQSRANAALGLIFVVNSLTVIALQVPLTALATRSAAVKRFACPAALALYSAAMFILAAAAGLAAVLAAVLVMSVAECLVLPLVDADLAALVRGAGLHRVFALSAMAVGIGEVIGSLAGVDAAARGRGAAQAFLLTLAVAALAGAAADAVLSRRLHRKRD